MKAIVFSKDRPMQLDLLLTSLERNAPGVFDVSVLCNAQGEFLEGYSECEYEHPEATFIPEDGLTYQVRSLLRNGGLVSFFTDDDVLFRTIITMPQQYMQTGKLLCFSLRLGKNTNFCYPHNRLQGVPKARQHGRLIWEWESYEDDFGYPMSLDGHIFRAEDLLPLVEERHFSTPNWLEVMLMEGATQIGRPLMACYAESRLVGVPINRVNTEMPNRAGSSYPWSVHDLNVLYLQGRRIDLDALDFSDIRGAHQEIPLVFR